MLTTCDGCGCLCDYYSDSFNLCDECAAIVGGDDDDYLDYDTEE